MKHRQQMTLLSELRAANLIRRDAVLDCCFCGVDVSAGYNEMFIVYHTGACPPLRAHGSKVLLWFGLTSYEAHWIPIAWGGSCTIAWACLRER